MLDPTDPEGSSTFGGVTEAEPVVRVSDRARRLHRGALVVDGHADTPARVFLETGYRFDERHGAGHVDLPRMREGGVDVQFFIAWVDQSYAATPGASAARADRLIDAIHDVIARTRGIRVVTDATAIEAVAPGGEVAVLIGVEGGHAIEGSLEQLQRFHERGARYLTLTWNNSHDWADACLSPPRHGGLTEFGREVVREMNRLGMLVDLSHVAPTTFRDAVEVSEAPVIASHAGARALTDHPRNLNDDQLRAIARSGGLVGVAFVPDFLDARFAALAGKIEREGAALEARLVVEHGDRESARHEARAWKTAQRTRSLSTSLSHLLDHIEHIARVAGIDHVALGSDLDGVDVLPRGLRDAADLPRVTELLLRRGHTEADVRKILGENWLRVLRAVTG